MIPHNYRPPSKVPLQRNHCPWVGTMLLAIFLVVAYLAVQYISDIGDLKAENARLQKKVDSCYKTPGFYPNIPPPYIPKARREAFK